MRSLKQFFTSPCKAAAANTGKVSAVKNVEADCLLQSSFTASDALPVARLLPLEEQEKTSDSFLRRDFL